MQITSEHQAQQFLGQAFENNSLMMLYIDAITQEIIHANVQAVKFFGYQPNDFKNKTFTSMCVTAETESDIDIESIFNTNVSQFSVTQRTASGQLKYMEVHVTPVEIDNRKQYLLTLIDATDRQQTVKQLQDAEARYRIIANFNHDWEYWITPDGLLGYISPSCERITGYTAEEFKDNPQLLNTIIHEDDLSQWYQYLNDLDDVSSPPRSTIEFRIRHRSGQIRWIEHVNQVVIDSNGDYLGHRVSNRDITTRQDIKERLKQNKEILELAMRTSNMAIWEWDIVQNEVKYDKRWAELLGYAFEEIQPMGTIWEKLVHPHDKSNSIMHMRELLDGDTDNFEFEQRMQSASGEWRWFMTRGTIFERAPDGTPLKFIGLDIDITDYKKVERDSFQIELERQRISVLSSFMQDAKHEFKTPLSRINTKLYLLNRTDDLDKREQLSNDIGLQIEEIDNLVESMMLMARLDTIHKIPHTPVDLSSTLNALVEELAPRVEERNLNLVDQISPKLPKFRGNTTDLHHAFYHILDNAIRYTDKHGHITISTITGQSNIIVEIQDTGAGISAEAVPHIFERFFREDKAHTTSGIGLGLPIAKRVIEHHGGTIRIVSEVDFGTTVQIIIPIR